MSVKNYLIAGGCSLLALGAVYLIGYHRGGDAVKIELASYKAVVEAYSNAMKAQKEQLENYYKTIIQDTEQSAAASVEDINQRYAELLALIADNEHSNTGDGVQQSSEDNSTAGDNTVSDPAPAVRCPVSPCKCRSYGTNGESARAEALKIARDCDALAVRYNSLLDIYQSIRREQVSHE